MWKVAGKPFLETVVEKSRRVVECPEGADAELQKRFEKLVFIGFPPLDSILIYEYLLFLLSMAISSSILFSVILRSLS